MPKKKLFDEDSDEDIAIKTENEYAKKYDTWRKKEEIYKLEQKYGPDALNSDASGSDSEDESDEPPEMSEEVEEQFLKTLAMLKTKDPRIYDPNFKCFDVDEEKKPEEKPKPKTLTFDDSDDDDDGGDIFKIEKKAEIDDAPTKSSEGPKKNKKGEKIKDYLTGKAEHIDDEVEKDLAPLKALWSDPKLSEGEAFLRDFILNKRYMEEGDNTAVVGDKLRDDAALEADEQLVEEQSRFERAYNFRFEEPDDEYLKRFPRTVNSLRPKDDRRSRARQALRERKEQEKARKMEEIGRLKALKLKEIHEKIAKIKEVTGNEELAFKEEDLEGDFDPEEHDRRMRALFDAEFYGQADDQKPVFPDLDEELEIENWDKYEEEAAHETRDDDGPHCEDEEFNMDADYNPNQPRAGLLEEIQKTLGKKRRNRKRKSKLAEILTVEKPKFVPEADKTYAQYMEEYYKLDCEDIIGGDLPTRFKYREVVPNDYGLTVEEILLADDKELTQWVPLKKIVRHRPDNVERGEVKTYAQRAADAALKKKVLPSLFRDLPEEPELIVPVEQASKKKKKKKNKDKVAKESETTAEHNELNASENNDASGEVEEETKVEVKDKKKKKNKQKISEDFETTAEHNELNASENNDASVEGEEETKDKKKKKHEVDEDSASTEVKKKKKHKANADANSAETNVSAMNTENGLINHSFEERKTKKKKKQVNQFTVENVTNQTPSQDTDKKINGIENNQQTKKDLKRKLEGSNEIPIKKKKNTSNVTNGQNSNKEFNKKAKQKDKFKNKNKFKSKQNDNSSDNPLAKLSDERLKAYGLNPKKYRSFLKYKKF
ncbi:protein KRI1 homolog [Ostrinia nubilalis]|uniref:protein KRI1 homolog n=1 Tax=Ostrinia nubilalis TaxID=29057 RepID=UPI003082324F